MRQIFTFALIASLTLTAFSGAAHAAGGGAKKPEGPVITYIELAPLFLPIIDDTGITQQVSLIVKLEVENAEKAAELDAIMPKIVDAFVADLYGTLSNQNAMLANGILRLDRVKSRLKATADKVAGDAMISDVLLQVVQQHKV